MEKYSNITNEELSKISGGSSNKIWEGVGYVLGAVSAAFASAPRQKPNHISKYTGPHKGII